MHKVHGEKDHNTPTKHFFSKFKPDNQRWNQTIYNLPRGVDKEPPNCSQ